MAGIAHGFSAATFDLDICHERSPANLHALASALQELHATLRGAPADVPFQLDARTLAFGDHFTFSTDAGDLECLGTPQGTEGFEDLVRNAVRMELAEDLTVKVAALDDLIRMKRATVRPKDRIALQVLGALRDELDGEPSWDRRQLTG
jgi:hypothetical protein